MITAASSRFQFLNRYHQKDVTVQGWCESCDNAEDGINVRWAFHKSESYIREHAPQEFVDKLLEAIQVAIDDEWDEESLCGIINTFS